MATSAQTGREAALQLARRVAKNAVSFEGIIQTWVYSVVFAKVVHEVHCRIRRKQHADRSELIEEKERVSKQGASFTLMRGEAADLSWLATLPNYVLPMAFLTLTVQTLRRGLGSPLSHGLRLLQGLFVMLPVMECVVQHDWTNPTGAQLREGYRRNGRFRAPLHFWAFVEVLCTAVVLRAGLRRRSPLSPSNLAGMAIILGIANGGLGITISHELIHKPRAVDKAIGHMLLTNVCYLHWADEHLVGHHEKVATLDDPATSRRGESLYAFLPRTVLGSFVDAWHLYAKRALEEGQCAWKTAFAFKTLGPPLAWIAVLSRITGCSFQRVLPAFVAQAAVSVTLLEAVNYVEHYGLRRKQLPDGSYEPVNPRHSWNSAHRLSNAILFKLQRHSDHHTFPQRPYQLLRNFEESPQLPTGYTGMLLLALCPPAFFWIMNPLVDSYNNGGDAKQEEKRAAKKFRCWCLLMLFFSILGSFALQKKRLQ